MSKDDNFYYFEPAFELGGLLAELRRLCPTRRKWLDFLQEHSDIDNMIRKWTRWVKTLHSCKSDFQAVLKREEWNERKVPEIPFDEKELNYLSSPLLDELVRIGGQLPLDAVCTLCRGGNLEVLKWFYIELQLYVCPYDALIVACYYGYVNILDWLKYKKIIPSVNKYELFRIACEHSQLQVLDWLHENYKYPKPVITFKIHAHYIDAFFEACIHGRTSVAQWLHQHYPQISHYYWLNDVFKGTCVHGHLETAVWFHETFPRIDPFIARVQMTPEIRNHFFPN